MTRKISLGRRHWRLFAALAVGLAAFFTARLLHAQPGLASLAAWNAGCVVFLATSALQLFGDDAASVQARAAEEDEGAPVVAALVLAAASASLAATFMALKEAKAVADHAPNAHPWPLALSVSTLVLSWLVIQTVFTFLYAHRYFGDADADGVVNGGVKFPGDPPRDYRDFVYLAVCVGCTSQVSDFNIVKSEFRSLITAHALIAFAFNVSVLALGVNMVASLLSQ